MTTQEGRALSSRRNRGPENTPRLRLKPKAPTTGYVDGAWWPHSDDLAHELPDLLAVLSVRLGGVDRVLYNMSDWPAVPNRLLIGGRAIRLDGYTLQPSNTIEVLGTGGNKMLLLVVPPLTDPDHAHEAMMTAAAPDDASTVDRMLEITAQDRAARDRTVAIERRWKSGVKTARPTRQDKN